MSARRATPRDDLISKLIAAEEEGERLSDVECINLVFNVLVGGVDTSQSQLAHAVRLLAEHASQWEMLEADPTLAGRAVEEALRYEPITPFTARILTDDVLFRDVTFPAGTVMLVCAFTGNRDLDDAAAGAQRRRSLRHHRRARRRAGADVRRRRPLLPRREPRARGAAGGTRVPRAVAWAASRSTASRSSRASRASTASPSCPCGSFRAADARTRRGCDCRCAAALWTGRRLHCCPGAARITIAIHAVRGSAFAADSRAPAARSTRRTCPCGALQPSMCVIRLVEQFGRGAQGRLGAT